MSAKVYFCNLRTRTEKGNKVNKIGELFEQAGLGDVVRPGDLTAIKLHFGERGNDGYINPVFVRKVVDRVKAHGGNPFLTDTNTLYSGSRHNSVDHLVTALEHGFDYTVTGAPLIISDGLRSDSYLDMTVEKKHFKKVKLARDLVTADGIIAMTHFKAHEVTGFGGAIKNIAMGGAPAVGKREQHNCRMDVNRDVCVGFGACAAVCPEGAITMAEGAAEISTGDCIGCGECLTVCPEKAIDINWAADVPMMIERMTEYAYGVTKPHPKKMGYMNFLINITPDCDCAPWSDAPIVPDIGFVASTDPVAIDQASFDLVNKQVGMAGSLLQTNLEAGMDKFKGLRHQANGERQLSYGEEIGLGTRDYELISL